MKITVPTWSLQDNFPEPNQPLKLDFIHPSLKEFLKLKMPVSVASKMSKNIIEVEKALTEYEKTRIIIIESLCERDADDKPVIENKNFKFSPEGYKEFAEKWNELLNTLVDIDISPVNESDIEKLEINGTCYATLSKYGFIQEKGQVVKLNGQAKELETV